MNPTKATNPQNKKLTFFDFCAGIGAGHTALKGMLDWECLGYSEINQKTEETYKQLNNFDKNIKNWGDITKIKPDVLPNFDLMIAGFPCQPFSIVGLRKGMKDQKGQIIFSLIKILNVKNPMFFLLENVKGLVNHNNGETLKQIIKMLKSLNYYVGWKVLNSLNFGVPQKRERVYIVGIRKDLINENYNFSFPLKIKEKNIKIEHFLINNDLTFIFNNKKQGWQTFIKYLNNKYNKNKFNLQDILEEEYLILDTRQSDLRLYRNSCPTLRAGRHGIMYVKNKEFRKLSAQEALLLQGFLLNKQKN